jgi:hypothetical protein
MTEIWRTLAAGARFAIIIGAVLAAVGSWARANGNIPANLPTGIEPEVTARLFLKHEPWLLYAEVYDSWQTDSRNERSVMVGSYYRLLDNLKVGAFYLAQTGARHDDDWFKDANRNWQWTDTSSRLENLFVLDASPRAMLSFLPGEHWVGELKARFIYNTFDNERSLVLRPGLTYFWLRGGAPFLDFFLQYEVWLPLNFGHKSIYEDWAYLGALYHLTDHVQLGGYGAYKQQFWSSTAAYTGLTGNTYVAEGDSTVIGLLAVFQFGI